MITMFVWKVLDCMVELIPINSLTVRAVSGAAGLSDSHTVLHTIVNEMKSRSTKI